jgi:hypothetical protein
VVNKHLLRDLVELGLWNETMKQELMRNNGSCSGSRYSSRLERIVQNSLGMSMKDIIYVTSTWLFCRSISIIELVYAKCQLF